MSGSSGTAPDHQLSHGQGGRQHRWAAGQPDPRRGSGPDSRQDRLPSGRQPRRCRDPAQSRPPDHRRQPAPRHRIPRTAEAARDFRAAAGAWPRPTRPDGRRQSARKAGPGCCRPSLARPRPPGPEGCRQPRRHHRTSRASHRPGGPPSGIPACRRRIPPQQAPLPAGRCAHGRMLRARSRRAGRAPAARLACPAAGSRHRRPATGHRQRALQRGRT